MSEMMQYTILKINGLEFTVGRIAAIILLILLSIFAIKVLRFMLHRQVKKRGIQDGLRKKLARLFRFTVFIIDAFALLQIMGMTVEQMMNFELIGVDPVYITPFHLFMVALVIIAIQLIVLVIHKVFDRLIENQALEIGLGMAIYQILKYVVWIIAIILLLDSVGVKITILLAGAGALLIGIGFGLQQIFSDIISGFILLFERNLKVHDIVEVDNIVGRVQNIGLRTSRIVTRDNIEMLIPNTKFIQDNVVNWSHMEKATRFYVPVGVAYGSDVRKVEKILLQAATDHPDVLDDPPPFVFFKDFGNSSLDFEVYFWTYKAFQFEKIRSDMRFAIDKAFRENNVEIPFPQRDVHIRTK